jgi:hypothetical protein
MFGFLSAYRSLRCARGNLVVGNRKAIIVVTSDRSIQRNHGEKRAGGKEQSYCFFD